MQGDGAQGFFDRVYAQAVGVAPLVAELAVNPVGQDAALADRHLQEAGAQGDPGDVAGGVRQDVGAAHGVDRPDAGGHRQRFVDVGVQGDAADRTGPYAAARRRGGIGRLAAFGSRKLSGAGKFTGGGKFTSAGEFTSGGAFVSGRGFLYGRGFATRRGRVG